MKMTKEKSLSVKLLNLLMILFETDGLDSFTAEKVKIEAILRGKAAFDDEKC